MRKSTLFVSAALTTFLLVMLVGVVSAYQAMTKTNPANVDNVAPLTQQQPVSSTTDTAPVLAPTSEAAPVTPEQAAQLAAQIIGRTDLYSVESSKLNDMDAYLVTFSSGDLVYVSLTGQILSITQVPTYSANVKSGGNRRNNGNSGGGSGASSGGGKHEDSGRSEHESDDGGEHEGGGD